MPRAKLPIRYQQRADAQRVIVARREAAVVEVKATAAIGAAVPADLAERLDNFNTRLNELETVEP